MIMRLKAFWRIHMPCNLNFNECRLGPNYPTPIYTCREQLLRLLDTSSNTVINPIVLATWAFLNFTPTQVIPSGGNVGLTLASSIGTDITLGVGDTIILKSGTYRINYASNGIIPSNGTLSLAVYQNGVLLADSIATVNGSVGSNVNIAGDSVITVPTQGVMLTIRNNNSVSETINSGNVFITRIN